MSTAADGGVLVVGNGTATCIITVPGHKPIAAAHFITIIVGHGSAAGVGTAFPIKYSIAADADTTVVGLRTAAEGVIDPHLSCSRTANVDSWIVIVTIVCCNIRHRQMKRVHNK